MKLTFETDHLSVELTGEPLTNQDGRYNSAGLGFLLAQLVDHIRPLRMSLVLAHFVAELTQLIADNEEEKKFAQQMEECADMIIVHWDKLDEERSQRIHNKKQIP